jgi:hypothetical protein
MTPEATALQPRRFSSRVTAQIPAATARNPTMRGRNGVRETTGGSAR